MRLRYARLTTAGPVRPVNQDSIEFWEAEDPLVREKQGSVALLADGVGGLSKGEVASRLAVDTALDMFRQTPPGLDPPGTLRRMFLAACARVHDASLRENQGKTMATTLVVTIVRNRVAHIAHVGDSRAYLIRKKKIFRLTKDHVDDVLQSGHAAVGNHGLFHHV